MRKTRDNKKKNSKSLKKTHSKRKTHSKKKPRSKRRTGKKSRRMRKNGGGTGFSSFKNPDNSSNCQYSPNTLHEFIILSAQLGDQAELKHLIKTCNEDIVSIINKPYSYGDTALIFASDIDHNEIAKILIETGANVNAQNNTGDTALLTATHRGNPELMKILIQAGANVNTQNNRGDTALMIAAFKSNGKIAKLLIEAGADVNMQNVQGKTALIIAASKCNDKMVKILLEAGSDTKIQDKTGKTAVMTATHQTMQMLKGDDSSECDNVAIRLQGFKIFQDEIKRDIDNFPRKGREPAAKVLYPGPLSRKVASYLGGGKKTRSKLYGGKKVPYTPNEKLYHGVGTKNYEMVQEAFRNGADYNSTGDKGSELIMVAIKNGDTKMISLLQKNGIDIKNFTHDINKIMEHEYF